jgi:acylphosphatase
MDEEQDGLVRRGFRVEGTVQGVGFRWWARSLAQQLGVAGYARNLPDGAVEVQASGRATGVEQLQRALGEGPPGARVTRVSAAEPDLDAPDDEFQIRRTS